MKKTFRRLLLIAGAVLCFLHAPAQAHAHAQRVYLQAEIEALLAPVALYPDPLLSHVLVASTYPTEVMEAARYGDVYASFHPSVRALLAYPELLQQMARSPAWMFDLGNAYLAQTAQVMDAVNGLRMRAQASAAPSIALGPSAAPQVISAAPQIIYLPQAAYIPQPLYVGQPLGVTRFIAQPVRQPHHRPTDRRPNSNPHPNGRPSPAAQMQRGNDPSPAARMQGHSRPPHVPPVVRVPEANRQPIVGQPDIRPRYPERRPRG